MRNLTFKSEDKLKSKPKYDDSEDEEKKIQVSISIII